MSLLRENSKRRPLVRLLIVIIILTVCGQSTAVMSADNNSVQAFDRESYLTSLRGLTTYPRVLDSTPLVYSKSYLLLDVESGEVVIEKNGYLQLPVASTTKMTTALVVEENLKLADVVTVSETVRAIGGAKIDLRPKETLTVKKLLQALLIYSANDAAATLAEAYTKEIGNLEGFVDEMNRYAKAHNLVNTTYDDPAGLSDEKGRSTAFELAQTARLLLKEPVLQEIVSTPQTTIVSQNGAITHELKNTNRLILSDSPFYYPGAIGVKTGFTHEAGHCLVAAAKIHQRLMIGVVLNTIESTNIASAKEMVKLFRWAESNIIVESY